MTVNLNCRLRTVSLGLDALVNLPGLTAFIEQHFLAGSHGDITLACDSPELLPNAAPADTSVTALQLHNYLLQVNQNSIYAPVSNICVLFASTYDPLPGAYGMMFDRGFTSSDDPNGAEIYLSQPRQGCAVFLSTIQANRTPDQYPEEAQFTTVHELGHIFNLQHDQSCLNFMRTSDSAAAFGAPAYLFTPDEQSQLEVCSCAPNVMPGASPFGSGNASNLPALLAKSAASKHLVLRIDVSRKRFWRFEPVHLELQLALPPNSTVPVIVPAVLDPGNHNFRIMIERDNGERHLYRSPTWTCGPPGSIEITATKPYRRDLPLFGQAGGYTFQRPGRHRIWIELIVDGMRLRSNVLSIEIKSEIGLDAAEKETRRILSDPPVAELLFHREDTRDQSALRKLARYILRVPDLPAAAEINYSLARAVLKRRQFSAPSEQIPQLRARAFFEQALQSPNLGAHQTLRAESFLAALSIETAEQR